MTRVISPTRIIWLSRDSTVVNAQVLLDSSVNMQPVIGYSNFCVMTNAGETPGIILDFGKEIYGGIVISSHTKEFDPVRVRVRFGESVSETMSGLYGDNNATNNHSVRDDIHVLPHRLGTTEIGKTGFRFVRLDLPDSGSVANIITIKALSQYRDIPYQGSFNCNDTLLNKIWQTDAYTVHLNMQEYLWDGIKRDRLVWIGDMFPELEAIQAVFGHHQVVNSSLDLIKDHTALPNWMNGISGYSIWWIVIQKDLFEYTADTFYLQQQHPYLKELVNQLTEYIDPVTGKEQLPDWRFLDWPTQANPEATHAGLHAMMIWAMQSASFLADVLDDEELKQTAENAASSLIKHRPLMDGAKQPAALMLLVDHGDKEDHVETLLADGARGVSTFFGYFILQAMAKEDLVQQGIDLIRVYWGAMLAMGATTFWEDFNIEWIENAYRIDELPVEGKKDIHGDFGAYCYLGFRHSLCHGWAAGPTAWLSQHVLGVEAAVPGFKEIRIKPHLGDLQWAEGHVPTPYGAIFVRHQKTSEGKIISDVRVPAGITVLK